MSITKGAMLISNANAVGTELVNQLGGTGYKPVEWSDKINLLGINSVDAPYAIKSIQAGTYTGEERGAIQYSNCNAVGSMLNKKLNTNRGFKPVEWEDAISKLTPLPENTVSGDICNIQDGADEVPIKSWEVEIAPTLSGVSSVVCTQAGKNLLDTAISETKTHNSVSITCDGNGKYTATGTATGGSANITFMLKTPCEIKSGMYLHLMNSGAVGSVAITLQKQDNTTIYAPSLSPANRIADLSSYVGETIYSIRFYVANGASFEMTLTPMLCFSNTATTFEPYQTPTVYTASLGRTIYGGTVDVVNGEGKETHNYIDMGNLSWTYHAPSGNLSAYFDTYLPNDAKLGNSQTAFDGYTADYTSIKSTQIALSGYDDMVMALGHGSRHFFLCDQRYSDANALTTALTGKILVYPLATPTDFTFTPITPTPETNTSVNFWNDTGSNTITYYQAPTALTRSTVSGSIASFSDADTRLTCVNAIATIPPSIAGVDTVQLVDAGVNLWGSDKDLSITRDKTIYMTLPAGSYVLSFDFISSTADPVPSYLQVAYSTDDGTKYNPVTVVSGRCSRSFTLSSNARALTIYASSSYSASVGVTTVIQNIQLEVGSTGSAYTSYIGTTYTANLPSTNYGGSVDFVNGGVKYGEAKIKFNELSWAYNAGYGRFQSNDLISVIKTPSSNDVPLDGLIAEGYITTVASVGSAQDMGIAVTTVSGYVLVYDSRYTDVTTFLSAEGEKNIVYPLATPTTASFTGQAIIPKTGTNNCYNNVGGNTEITYFTNT